MPADCAHEDLACAWRFGIPDVQIGKQHVEGAPLVIGFCHLVPPRREFVVWGMVLPGASAEAAALAASGTRWERPEAWADRYGRFITRT